MADPSTLRPPPARKRLAFLVILMLSLGAYSVYVHSQEPPRVAKARAGRGAEARRLCKEAGVKYPPRELFLRVLKSDGAVECWARSDDQPFRLVKTFVVTAASGAPGPKRREGDNQVPEGFYRVAVFNPESNFHLSLGLNYPNDSDRVLSDPEHPGYDIYLHGGAVSVGCVPIGDEEIELLYLLARDASASGRPIQVHIFPARMSGAEWETFRQKHTAENPSLAKFWDDLLPAYAAFETTHLLPNVQVGSDGRYLVK